MTRISHQWPDPFGIAGSGPSLGEQTEVLSNISFRIVRPPEVENLSIARQLSRKRKFTETQIPTCVNYFSSRPSQDLPRKTRHQLSECAISLLAFTLGVEHYGAVAADPVLGPGDVGSPVVDLVEGVILGVGIDDLARLGVEEDHVDAVAAAALVSLGNLKVALPVKGEAVATVGHGALEDGAGVVLLLDVAADELCAVVEDGREVVGL